MLRFVVVSLSVLSASLFGQERFFRAFPLGHVFIPLIADTKQPYTGLTTGWLASSSDLVDLGGFASVGETFGLVRMTSPTGQMFQLSIAGGVSAQFDLLSSSMDLINADYLISTHIDYRHGPLSFRSRLYHQSSHLGDEFLINNPTIERFNLSYESFDLLTSYDYDAFRFIGGGQVLYRRDPKTLDPFVFHISIEYRRPEPVVHFYGNTYGKLLAGIDLKHWQQNGFAPSVNIKAGLEVGRIEDPEEKERFLRILFEFYRGASPHGQFFLTDEIVKLGLGFQIGL